MTKHASNSPVTFVTHKRFAVLFFLLSCRVSEHARALLAQAKGSTFFSHQYEGLLKLTRLGGLPFYQGQVFFHIRGA